MNYMGGVFQGQGCGNKATAKTYLYTFQNPTFLTFSRYVCLVSQYTYFEEECSITACSNIWYIFYLQSPWIPKATKPFRVNSFEALLTGDAPEIVKLVFL